ncbi:hypothetical protein ACWDZ6_29840 [Streptomyces sp. NPDC002926]
MPIPHPSPPRPVALGPWAPALARGFAFTAAQFAVATHVLAQLVDLRASLVGAAAPVAVPDARAGRGAGTGRGAHRRKGQSASVPGRTLP